MKDGDAPLVERLKSGDMAAFRELVERYKKRAYFMAFDYMGTHEDAEDISQEVFLRVYQSIGSFRGEAQFSTWLYRIVVNLCVSEKRKVKAKMIEYYGESVPGEVERATERSLDEDPEHTAQASLTRESIQKALDRLPSRQRSVFVLRFYHDMSLKEIGTVLRLSEGTVKSHLFRTIRKLRTYLKPYMADFTVERGGVR